ncbi:hypothetical protein EPUL_001099, partial [Erysiphe pulchra]
MTIEQPRRRAYGERDRFQSGFKSTLYGARTIGSRGNYFASRSRGRGRGQARDCSAAERGKSKFEYPQVTVEDKRATDKLHGTESDTEIIPKSGLKLKCDDKFQNVDEKILPVAHSYSILMQNFATEAPVKRRKISHNSLQEQSDDKNFTSNDEFDININNDLESLEDHVIENDDFSEDDNDDEGTTSLTHDPFSCHFADTCKALVTVSKESDEFQYHPIADAKELFLKKKLAITFSELRSKFDVIEKSIAPFLFNYQDLLFCLRTPSNSETLRRLICLHFLNHILKTRDKVIKNNAKIARETTSIDFDFRDQGFTRPKVLLILPTRESCVRFIKMINSIYKPEQQENRKRFDDMYVRKFEDKFENKADDFRELFEGNNDDMFRLGLKFTRKTIKYFAQFYNSDIILASPLGLLVALKGKDGKRGDHDFLSSIEIVIVEQADALLMQNWEHMEYIFDHLNLQPKETHGCDFSRVRNWYLDNKAIHFRQTIALSAFNTPDINSLLFNKSKNWAGRVKVTATHVGVIQELGLKIKQTFSRLEAASFMIDPDARFTYFTTVVIPALTRHIEQCKGTLIFIPSYLDFVRVRNYFSMSEATTNLSFGSISEYSSIRDVARSRSYFFSGRQSILLYTERAHHFRRYRIRGTRKVIMYGLPDNPTFYREIIEGFLGRSIQEGHLVSEESHVSVLFSKWDALKLERIVGTTRAANMIKEKGKTFEF